MKKHILGLVLIIINCNLIAVSSIEIDKDGIKITASYDQYMSDKLKNRNMAYGNIFIKNNTNEAIEVPKYFALSPFMANEELLREAMCIKKSEIIAMFAMGAIANSFMCRTAGLITSDFVWMLSNNLSDGIEELFKLISRIGSPITATICTLYSYFDQITIQEFLQHYIDRKAITIPAGKCASLDVYIDVKKYQASDNKNITIKLLKKNSTEALIYEIDTGLLLQPNDTTTKAA